MLNGINQRLSTLGGGGGSTGGVNHHQCVKVLAGEQNIQRPGVMLNAGIVTQIQRVGDLDMGRQSIAQFLAGLLTQHGQLAIAGPELIKRQRRRRGTVADDHQPVTAQRAHVTERFHCGKELMGIFHTQQTGSLDGGIPGGIHSGAGMQ